LEVIPAQGIGYGACEMKSIRTLVPWIALALIIPMSLLWLGATRAGNASSLPLSTPINLASYLNNIGVSADHPITPTGNIDTYHDSLSASALKAAGLSTKRMFSYNGLNFTFARAGTGQNDNIQLAGQTIRLTIPISGTTLGFLGLSIFNSVEGDAEVTYTDGLTTTFKLGFSDWTLNGGLTAIHFGNKIAMAMSYRTRSDGSRDTTHKIYLYYAEAALLVGHLVATITLPRAQSRGEMHLFAMTIATRPISTQPIALGAMPFGAGEDPRVIDRYNALVYPHGGGHTAAVNYFGSFQDASVHTYGGLPASAFNGGLMDAIYQREAIPFFSWASCDVVRPDCSDRQIANGSDDPYLIHWARAAAAYRKPFYLRFDWEMNLSRQPWYPGDGTPENPGNNGDTPASFIDMWRHVHAIFTENGATNVNWVWCPNTMPGGADFTALYPGDAYVDTICLDGYNQGATPAAPDGWHSFTDEMAASYDAITALAPTKPLFIGETASSEVGGYKAGWISQMANDIPIRMPRIRAVLWFNQKKEADWRVNSSPASLQAYRAMAARPLYKAQLTGTAWINP
jgi:glycosyl hydrolase family 26